MNEQRYKKIAKKYDKNDIHKIKITKPKALILRIPFGKNIINEKAKKQIQNKQIIVLRILSI